MSSLRGDEDEPHLIVVPRSAVFDLTNQPAAVSDVHRKSWDLDVGCTCNRRTVEVRIIGKECLYACIISDFLRVMNIEYRRISQYRTSFFVISI